MVEQLRDTRGRFMRAPTESEMSGVAVLSREMEEFILYSDAVREAKIVLAKEVAAYWKSIAPEWGDHDPKRGPPSYARQTKENPTGGPADYPGDYAASIKVVEEPNGRVYVAATKEPLATWLEYGTSKMKPLAPGAHTLAHFDGGPVGEGSDRLYTG